MNYWLDLFTGTEGELLRLTFTLRECPLPEVCGFLPISVLKEKAEGIKKLATNIHKERTASKSCGSGT